MLAHVREVCDFLCLWGAFFDTMILQYEDDISSDGVHRGDTLDGGDETKDGTLCNASLPSTFGILPTRRRRIRKNGKDL